MVKIDRARNERCISTSSTTGHLVLVLSPRLLMVLGIALFLLALWLTATSPSSSWQSPSSTSTDQGRDAPNQLELAVQVTASSANAQPTRTSQQHLPSYQSLGQVRADYLRQHQDQPFDACHWYMAESAIPRGGLGLFAGVGVHPGELVGFPDLCIFVSDAPRRWTHLRSHSFGQGSFFGQYEGSNSRAACEGFTTMMNTLPDALVNTVLGTLLLPTHAGLNRATSPGAGAISHHFGIVNTARDVITAGTELIIDYGDFEFDPRATYKKAHRPVSWLQQHGWCIDHLVVGPVSLIPHAGRGAFAKRNLHAGQIIAPMPLQVFPDRAMFHTVGETEQLFVNYCLQPKHSTMLFYPYGPAVNLINHGGTSQANAYLQWSTSSLHHASWLDLPSWDEFWKLAYDIPGQLLLEVVAMRDIAVGEEVLVHYGEAWEIAWNAHVQQWQAPTNASQYVYPADMDETEPLRTVLEQRTNPYPYNLVTMCTSAHHPEKDASRHNNWEEPTEWTWWEGMTYCFILERSLGVNGDYFYKVELLFSRVPQRIEYDETKLMEDRVIDKNVPRRAIRFIERPYMDDEHLPNAFRHPIHFPDHLVPDIWRNVKASKGQH